MSTFIRIEHQEYSDGTVLEVTRKVDNDPEFNGKHSILRGVKSDFELYDGQELVVRRIKADNSVES